MKFSIEGTIGAGKSTLAEMLAAELGAELQVEPDEKADNAAGVNPYLASYYQAPERWALTMQIHLMTLRTKQAQDAEFLSRRGRVVVSDRSLPGDLAFARVQVKRGIMTPAEYDTYVRAYQINLDRACYPDAVLHVTTGPDEALRRVARRMQAQTGRACEAGIPRGYMVDLDAEIKNVLRSIEAQGVPVLRIDWPDLEGGAKWVYLRKHIVPRVKGQILTRDPNKIYHVEC